MAQPQLDLKVTQRKLSNGKIQLNVTVPAALIENAYKGAAVNLSTQNRIDVSDVVDKGDEVIIQKVIKETGEAQFNAFLNIFTMNSLASFAVSQKKLSIVMDPVVSSSEQVERGKEFSFVAVVSPKPVYELSSYDPVTVKIPKAEVTEAEIDSQLYHIAESRAEVVDDKKVVPAVTDAWVAKTFPDAKNIEGLRALIRAEGEDFKARETEELKLFASASEFAKRLEAQIDDELYEFTRGVIMSNMQQQIQQGGMSLEDFLQQQGLDEQSFSMQIMMQARETLRQGFTLDAVARHLKMKLEEEDINAALTRMAPGNEAAARAQFEGAGRMYQLEEAALRIKANRWIYDNATFEVLG
jgi:trigger factor